MPTLAQLLTPAAQRVQTSAVGPEYDQVNIGLAATQTQFGYTFQATGCDDLDSGQQQLRPRVRDDALSVGQGGAAGVSEDAVRPGRALGEPEQAKALSFSCSLRRPSGAVAKQCQLCLYCARKVALYPSNEGSRPAVVPARPRVGRADPRARLARAQAAGDHRSRSVAQRYRCTGMTLGGSTAMPSPSGSVDVEHEHARLAPL